jgi:hypothetical protein
MVGGALNPARQPARDGRRPFHLGLRRPASDMTLRRTRPATGDGPAAVARRGILGLERRRYPSGEGPEGKDSAQCAIGIVRPPIKTCVS